mmetsp:Transcript_26485/g.60474  ORF Transcript_26485/g.60474 Transcript_26485/m.60474 type:complete len:204 (+) Transcript_26485:2792-3403(+)
MNSWFLQLPPMIAGCDPSFGPLDTNCSHASSTPPPFAWRSAPPLDPSFEPDVRLKLSNNPLDLCSSCRILSNGPPAFSSSPPRAFAACRLSSSAVTTKLDVKDATRSNSTAGKRNFFDATLKWPWDLLSGFFCRFLRLTPFVRNEQSPPVPSIDDATRPLFSSSPSTPSARLRADSIPSSIMAAGCCCVAASPAPPVQSARVA